MNAVRLFKTLALAALVAASHLPTAAAPVTFWFSGVVDDFQNPSNTAPAGVTVGTPFVGRISYDPAGVWYAETNSAGGGVYSQYNYNDTAAFAFTVYLADNIISNTVHLGTCGQFGVEDNVSGRDSYFAESGNVLMVNGTNMVAGPNQASMNLNLTDPSTTALTSTALPLTAPALSQFGNGAYLTIAARNANGSVYLCYLSGPASVISTNEIVPLNIRRPNAATAQLAWPIYANGYALQSTTNLTTPNWQTVGTAVVNTATEHTVSVFTTGTQLFYRLKK